MIDRILNKFMLYRFRKSVSNKDIMRKEAMVRVGTGYGGWYVPANLPLKEDSVCYCAGAGEDISFDCALASQYKCHTHIFDPTPRAIAHFEGLKVAALRDQSYPINNSNEYYSISKREIGRLHFHPFGLSDCDESIKFYYPADKSHVSCSMENLQNTNEFFIAECKSLRSIMNHLRHDAIDLLKIDIEGAEYRVIKSMIAENILPKILCIEFDEGYLPSNYKYISRISKHIDLLEKAGMRCVFVDGWNVTFLRHDIIL